MTTPDVEVFEQHRAHLFGVAYRMLGDVAAAEDAVQDTYLRWRERPDDPVREPAALLTTITTRLAIDRLRVARARRESYVGQWLAEPVFTERLASAVGPDEQAARTEAVTLGFLSLLEELSPLERAAFVLHDVLDYGFGEVAQVLDRKPPACRQLASRARAKLADRQHTPARPSTERERRAVTDFVAALASADVSRLEALLTDDVVAVADGGGVVSAAIRPVTGRDRAARYLAGVARKRRPDARIELVTVNAEPALLVMDGEGPTDVVVIGVTDAGVRRLHIVRNPDKLAAVAAGVRLAEA